MSVQCIKCNSTDLSEVSKGDSNEVYYLCNNCGNESGRAIATSGIKIEIMGNGEPKHFTVGAIIREGDKFLVVKRRVWPYVYSIVAGHIDEGESPEDAIKRELNEEIGFSPTRLELLVHEPHLIGDKCRKGADVHEYFFYEAWGDTTTIANVSEEHADVLWIYSNEAESLEFTFAAQYMLTKIGLLSTLK